MGKIWVELNRLTEMGYCVVVLGPENLNTAESEMSVGFAIVALQAMNTGSL